MADRIPAIVRCVAGPFLGLRGILLTSGLAQVRDRVSAKARRTLDVVAKFVEEECIP